MTINTIAGNNNTAQTFAANSDQLIIQSTGSLTVSGATAIDGAGFDNLAIVVNGLIATDSLTLDTITLGSLPANTSVNSTLTIGENGQIISESIGANVFGTGFVLHNNGNITTKLAAANLIADFSSIINNGSIASRDIAIVLDGVTNTITNAGSINGILGGIFISGQDTAVTNTGMIAGRVGIEFADASTDNRVVNHGVVASTDDVAIRDGDGSNTFVNRGTIQGDVELGGGEDIFDTIGGVVTGTVYGGAGADRYFIDSETIVLREESDPDIDRVDSLVTWRLGRGFEELHLLGSDAINGYGNDLNNELIGNEGRNVLKGFEGDDDFYYSEGGDTYRGGAGIDFIGLSDSDGSLRIDLVKGTITGDDEDTMTLKGIENVEGGNANDTIIGTSGANVLYGYFGSDRITGGAGNDMLSGLSDGPDDDFARDTFVFAKGCDQDTIFNFSIDVDFHDLIDLSKMKNITSFGDLKQNHMDQVGADIVINAGSGDKITLLDRNVADMDADFFKF